MFTLSEAKWHLKLNLLLLVNAASCATSERVYKPDSKRAASSLKMKLEQFLTWDNAVSIPGRGGELSMR